jgi:hypothetical protein
MFTNTVVFRGFAQAVSQLHHMKKSGRLIATRKAAPAEKKWTWWFNKLNHFGCSFALEMQEVFPFVGS